MNKKRTEIFRQEFNNTIRNKFLEYHHNNTTCWNCGKVDTEFNVHHIVPLSKGGTNNFNNLSILCKECHKKVHSKGSDYQDDEKDNGINIKNTVNLNVTSNTFNLLNFIKSHKIKIGIIINIILFCLTCINSSNNTNLFFFSFCLWLISIVFLLINITKAILKRIKRILK